MKAGVMNGAGDIVIPSRATISAAILFLACTRLVPSAITSSLPACRIGVIVAQINLAWGAYFRIVATNAGKCRWYSSSV